MESVRNKQKIRGSRNDESAKRHRAGEKLTVRLGILEASKGMQSWSHTLIARFASR